MGALVAFEITAGTVRTATLPWNPFGVVREPHVRALATPPADALVPGP